MVYHANYLVWFEVARGELFWQRGRDYHRDVEERGFIWPVTEASVRYLASAHYGELVTVRAWVQEWQSRSVLLAYEVVNAETRQTLCTGWTRHMNVDREGKVRRIPDEIRAMLA
jgi:acyl-CoA thioester hydrolase